MLHGAVESMREAYDDPQKESTDLTNYVGTLEDYTFMPSFRKGKGYPETT